MKLEEPGWLPAAACCMVLLLAWLTFALTTSFAVAKGLTWARRQLRLLRTLMGSLIVPGTSRRVSARSTTNRKTASHQDGGNIS
jgi:hypothetical protein